MPATPELRERSIRWISHADTNSPHGLGTVPVVTQGAASELRCDDGHIQRGDELEFSFETDGMARTLRSISARFGGVDLDLNELVGTSAASGYRARLNATVAPQHRGPNLAMFVLDDVPAITLVSAYTEQYEDARSGTEAIGSFLAATPEAIDFQADMCTGWARDAGLVQFLVHDKELITPVGPSSPDVTAPGSYWHTMKPLPAHSTRRLRRVDVWYDNDGGTRFDSHFRDSHVDLDGVERTLHEYTIEGLLDGDGEEISTLHVTAHVLPWQECPGALASAQRVVGVELASLRDYVRREFRGVSTCTHLNDSLRALESLATMLQRLG